MVQAVAIGRQNVVGQDAMSNEATNDYAIVLELPKEDHIRRCEIQMAGAIIIRWKVNNHPLAPSGV